MSFIQLESAENHGKILGYNKESSVPGYSYYLRGIVKDATQRGWEIMSFGPNYNHNLSVRVLRGYNHYMSPRGKAPEVGWVVNRNKGSFYDTDGIEWISDPKIRVREFMDQDKGETISTEGNICQYPIHV